MIKKTPAALINFFLQLFFFFIFGLFFFVEVRAQVIPPEVMEKLKFQIKRISYDTPQQVRYKNQNIYYNSELTPLSLRQDNGKYLYILPSSWTWMCTSTQSFSLRTDYFLQLSDCKLITQHELVSSVSNTGEPTWVQDLSLKSSSRFPWKRAYDGMFGFKIIDTKFGKRVIGIKHGENMNAKFGNIIFKSTVYPNVSETTCWSGYVNNQYQHCWDSFASFANLAWADYKTINTKSDIRNFYDEGPIIWPSKGYKDSSGNRTGAGIYHSTMFVDGDFIYLFAINSAPDRGGRQCLMASRSPKSEGGLPHTWKNYYEGSFSENALPLDFSKEKMERFYSVRGGRATCVFDSTDTTAKERNHLFFNVAKVRNTPYYLGVVEETEPPKSGVKAKWHLRFVISSDLIHWYPVQTCTINQGCYNHIFHWTVEARTLEEKDAWPYAILSYPVLYNVNGVANDVIDADEFYLLGTNIANNHNLFKLKLSLNLPKDVIIPTNTPTPTLAPTANCPKKNLGDANCDGKINGYDFSIWLRSQCTTGCVNINLRSDFNNDRKVDDYDYNIWFNNRE